MPDPADHPKPFACPTCQKRFAREKSKDDHVLLTHENGGRFKCGHCDRTFQNRSHFERHEKIHREKRPFCCQLCPKRFTRETHLKVHHVDRHTERKFKCNKCSKIFARTSNLQRHLLTHSAKTLASLTAP